jgi:hypothetical protein
MHQSQGGATTVLSHVAWRRSDSIQIQWYYSCQKNMSCCENKFKELTKQLIIKNNFLK